MRWAISRATPSSYGPLFDLHLYLANWGSHGLMIRLRKQATDRIELDRFIAEADCVERHSAGENVILDISVQDRRPG